MIIDLLDRKFKIKVIKLLTKIKRMIHEQNDIFNKEVENVKKYKTEITEFKNSMERLNIRLDQAEENQ